MNILSIHKLELEGSKHAKSKYIFQRIFPSVSLLREHNKFSDTHPFLIQIYVIIRLVTKHLSSGVNGQMKDLKESKMKIF